MDRVELSREDIGLLLNWRDENKDLVRSMPATLKAIEIVFKHNSYRIKGIRKGDLLTLHLSDGAKSLGHVEMEIDFLNRLVLKKGKLKCDEDGFRSVLTVYCSVMAMMAAGPVVNYEAEPKPPRNQRNSKTGGQRKPAKRVTYIIRKVNGSVFAAPKGSHASPRGIFSVRGHFRHYKSGKVIWISEYRKGTGKKKRKTYKVGGGEREK